MATVTATDFLVATGTPGLWVRLHNNVSGTDYYSTAVSDPQGAFTYTVPTGEYSLYVGSAATVPGTPTLRNGHFQVAVRNGDDAALNSATATIGPYTPSALAVAAVAAGATVLNGDVWAAPPRGGGLDDTANFTAAWNFAVTRTIPGHGISSQYLMANAPLRLWPGEYNLSSLTGLETPDAAAFAFWVEGSGKEATRVLLPAGKFFIDTNFQVVSCLLRGIQFYGGAGAFRMRYTGANVFQHEVIEDNEFIGYTVCAIAHNSADAPYWKIRRNVFDGVSASSIGVALGGDSTNSEINDNAFFRNRYHIKLKGGVYNSVQIQRNDFVRNDAYVATPRTDIWIVPTVFAGGGEAGQGLSIDHNKFGNELINTNDFKVLIADENAGSGTDIGSRSHATTQSTSFLTGALFQFNRTAGAAGNSPAFITTYTDLIEGLQINYNMCDGTVPLPYWVNKIFDNTTIDRNIASSIVGPNYHQLQGVDNAPVPLSNAAGEIGYMVDPGGFTQADPGQPSAYPGAINGSELVNLTITAMSSYAVSGGASLVAANDVFGRANTDLTNALPPCGAATLTLPNGGIVSTALAGVVIGKPAWIEFDVLSGGGTPLTAMYVEIADATPNVLFRRYIPITSYWRRHRFLLFPKVSAATTLRFVNTGGGSGTVLVGRPWAYIEREPFGNVFPQGLALPQAAPAVAAGGTVAETAIGTGPVHSFQALAATGYSAVNFVGSNAFWAGVGNVSEVAFGVAGKFFIYDGIAGAMRFTIDPTTGLATFKNALAAAKDLRRSRQTPTETVLVSGVDATGGELVGVTITAARVVGAPLNPAIGQRLTFNLLQSGAGAFAITWNAAFKGITGGTSGATGTRASFSFDYDGTNWNLNGAQPTWVA